MHARIQGNLRISNPAPRVGDIVDVQIAFTDSDADVGLPADPIKITTPLRNAGTVWIGPFTFKIDGQELVTDSISVQVEEELNFNVNLFSVRQVTHNGENYLITEHVAAKPKKGKPKFARLSKTNIAPGLVLDEITSSETYGGSKNYAYVVYKIIKNDDFNKARQLLQPAAAQATPLESNNGMEKILFVALMVSG
ncbi:MAG TPA: hypothetical protein VEC12_14795 [Bacteroidia bacterium]|nr:hypothetical protein [Bacteroidia bacterium]